MKVTYVTKGTPVFQTVTGGCAIKNAPSDGYQIVVEGQVFFLSEEDRDQAKTRHAAEYWYTADLPAKAPKKRKLRSKCKDPL
jgi:hypothetical protein